MCNAVKEINLPDTVSDIGNIAASGFSGIEKITVSPRNTHFSTSGGMLYNSDKTELLIGCGGGSVVLPESVKSIGDYAFYFNTVLASVTLPDGLRSIGEMAFACCSSLTSLDIPGGVTDIGSGAFQGTLIETLELPAAITVVPEKLCSGCPLKTIVYNGRVTELGADCFANCPLEGDVIPDTVRIIGRGAFAGALGSMYELSIPDSVEVIGSFAFSGIRAHTVNLGSSVRVIGDYAFYSNQYMSAVNFPDGLEYIGEYAFFGTTLRSVTIPDSVIELGESAFRYCFSLENLKLGGSLRAIPDYCFYECSSLGSVTIPDSVVSIGYHAFDSVGGGYDKTLTLGNSLMLIEQGAFYRAGFSEVTIPASVCSIGSEAFFPRYDEAYTACFLGSRPIAYTGDSGFAYLFGFPMDDSRPTIYAKSGTDTERLAIEYGYNFSSIGDTEGYAEPFSDVSRSKWYFGEIDMAYCSDLMDGMGGGLFMPDGTLTVAQAITMACRTRTEYLGEDEIVMTGAPWYNVYIDYAIKNGIIKDGDFTDYNAEATRGEMAYIFANALPDYYLRERVLGITPPDVSDEHMYAAEIRALYTAGIVQGNDELGTFAPETNITRAQAAAIIVRMAIPGARLDDM